MYYSEKSKGKNKESGENSEGKLSSIHEPFKP